MKKARLIPLLLLSVLVSTCENPFTPEQTQKKELLKLTHDYKGGSRIVRNVPIVLTWSEVTITEFARYAIHRSTIRNGNQVWEERAEITNPLQISYSDTLDDDDTFRYRVRIVDASGNFRDAQTEELVLRTTSLTIPDDYESMQEAFDTPFVDDGDTLFVKYVGPRTFGRPFRFTGKDVVIMGSGEGGGTEIAHGDTIMVVDRGKVDGFTFRKGWIVLLGSAVMSNCLVTEVFTSGFNAAVTVGDSAEIRNSTIAGNRKGSFYGAGGDGAGLVLRDRATVRNCRITRNKTSEVGGGISVYDRPTIVNTIIDNNYAEKGGGGIVSMGVGGPRIVNCVIYRNSSGGTGQFGAMMRAKRGTTINTIVWGNSSSGSETFVWRNASYCDIENYSGGTGNISSPPQFVDPASGDFHLLSGSPCADAGHPRDEYLDLDGSRNDMGVFGGPYGD